MKQKNLIYVFADQWRAHAVGFAHCDPVLTPNMDAFAAGGMKFTNAISTYPLCSPHRASLMTGKYPTSCGVWTNCKPGLDETILLKPQETCISDVLAQGGYHTAYIGKWHLDASELNFNRNPPSGAAVWDAFTPPGERRHGFEFWYSYGAMDDHLHPHYWKDTPHQIKPELYSPIHETNIALEYLEHRDKDNPFALFLSWNPPHPPYDLLPEEYLTLYRDKTLTYRENVPQQFREDPLFQLNMRRYFGAITALDEQFGRITRYLKENDLEQDTILVLSADHGDTMGSHGLYGKNIWYEESIRIPLVFGGSDIPPGSCDSLLASPDHMPTLLGLLGLEPPSCVEGSNLAPAVYGALVEHAPETAFLCMIPGMPEMVHAYSARGLYNRSFGWRGIRTKTHTYIVDNGTQPGCPQQRYLYDNEHDPYQLSPMLLTVGSREDAQYEALLRPYLERLNDSFLLNREEY
ncbi:MAG: sulfatase [Angelakisella sp.]